MNVTLKLDTGKVIELEDEMTELKQWINNVFKLLYLVGT